MHRSRAWKGPVLVRRRAPHVEGSGAGAVGDDRPTLPYGEGQLRELTSEVRAVAAAAGGDVAHGEAGDALIYALERRAGWFADAPAGAASESSASLQPCSMDADEDDAPVVDRRRRQHLQRAVVAVACLCVLLSAAGALRALTRSTGDVPSSASASARGIEGPVDARREAARIEREDARRALDEGAAARAAEAAERATSLDPTDAAAWILLASSRLRLGEARGARAAFLRCADEATRGPVADCRAMAE